MGGRDYHIHTTFCDGRDSARAIVEAAVEKQMESVGFSGHGYTFFDESYCMSREGAVRYRQEIAGLKEEYRGVIDIRCGVEQDFYSEADTSAYDYVIGSVHYLKLGEEYIPVDETPEILQGAAEWYFGGDMYLLVEEYYKTVQAIPEKTGADIIGHFDLISKFNERKKLFSEEDPRYEQAWKGAVDRLLASGIPFEINTGGISRGYKSVPYPNEKMLQYILSRGGKTILSSDSHCKNTLCFQFEKYRKYERF